MGTKIIIPLPQLCNDCNKHLNEFDSCVVRADKIQKKFIDLIKKRTKTPETAARLPAEKPVFCTVKEAGKTVMYPINMPVQQTINPLEVESVETDFIKVETEEPNVSSFDPLINPSDVSVFKTEDSYIPDETVNVIPTNNIEMLQDDEDSDDDFDEFSDLEEIQDPIQVALKKQPKQPVRRPVQHSVSHLEKARSQLGKALSLKISTISSVSNPKQSGPKFIIGVNPHRKFTCSTCITCSRSYYSSEAFMIHKKLHEKTSHHQCDVCKKMIDKQLYVTHVLRCLKVDPNFLKCTVENCGVEMSTVEEITEHLKYHQTDPKVLVTPKVIVKETTEAAQKIKEIKKSVKKKFNDELAKQFEAPKIFPGQRELRIEYKYPDGKKPKPAADKSEWPSRRPYSCDKCGKLFPLGKL